MTSRPTAPSVTVQFLASQSLGQVADATTALVIARVLLGGDDGVVDAETLLETLAATAVPYVIVGPISGIVADRWDRRRALGVIHLARAVLTLGAVAAITVGGRTPGLVTAACLLGAARLVYTLRAASLPLVAPQGNLVGVDSRSLGIGMTAVLVGGAFGGVGAGRFPATALLLAATLQVIAAIGFSTLRRDLGGRSRNVPVPWPRLARRIGLLIVSSPTRFVVAVTTSVRFLLGASFATFVLLASEAGLGPDGYLLALAVTGAGSFVGATLAPRAHRRLGAAGVVACSYLVPATSLSTAGLLDRRVVLEIAVFGSFLAFQLVRVVADATVQSSIADETRGRVFAVYDVAYNLSYFAGAAVAILLGAAGDPDRTFTTIGVAAGVTLTVLASTRRSLRPDRRRPAATGPENASSERQPRTDRLEPLRSSP